VNARSLSIGEPGCDEPMSPAGANERVPDRLGVVRSAEDLETVLSGIARAGEQHETNGHPAQARRAPMAAITAGGQNVTASVVNSTEVQVSFNANSDGSFRVIIAAPKWTGGDATTTASNLIGGDTTATTSSLLSTQSSWWNSHWANTGLVEMNSSEGTAQYIASAS
jgi:hypothetical protein